MAVLILFCHGGNKIVKFSMKSFHITYVFLGMTIIIFTTIKFSEVKIGVVTFLLMFYRLLLAHFLKVGFANVGNMFDVSKMNVIEKAYLLIIGICVIPVWIGFIYMGLILERPYIDNNHSGLFIVFIVMTVIAVFMDLFIYILKKQ